MGSLTFYMRFTDLQVRRGDSNYDCTARFHQILHTAPLKEVKPCSISEKKISEIRDIFQNSKNFMEQNFVFILCSLVSSSQCSPMWGLYARRNKQWNSVNRPGLLEISITVLKELFFVFAERYRSKLETTTKKSFGQISKLKLNTIFHFYSDTYCSKHRK